VPQRIAIKTRLQPLTRRRWSDPCPSPHNCAVGPRDNSRPNPWTGGNRNLTPSRTTKTPPVGNSLANPTLSFETQKLWERWLAQNHQSSPGLWLRFAKKDSTLRSITHQEALEVALCYGWIDGQKRSESDTTWLQKFVPRGPRSIWSKINREAAAALIRCGRMQPAGLAAVERAKQDGRWAAAYEGQKKATVPADLQAALDKNPKAKAFFAALDSKNRYAVLFRVHTAKKPETRARRIEQFVSMLAKHEKLHP
jgi:uncharacterized protein YdeI (YjbR/CyaY-like superfamily)